ncbi:DUF2000 domain-containing protein [Clostridium luticellarii]|jgi:hypothetical protein|uniref:DUF2000 domain-containing protein n=1 Tax=Clostridium luticellarii TaxID=1691940 RepID=A0A2T0BN99_9CLOT|nr:DUF2000 domain-containing protein [Clostridium luticellarii]MCI1945431.1 DUF2000 domain-containing protein [Clostridium luticellarii]MCI1968764.1 DUF2000 domain-containing protein [Clostridium luticellarii]MCI1994962.1 DUF2000 domain-containing protein [Clostridium luticellarii]MCI2040191.1 DUF2000 domain-containing protein [Clostridium luticellarii]PRR85355.1 hypothetical protein CLLU_16360 [Clostridium luticellarii]
MDKEENIKCVMVINEDLPLGVIANTSAILGITLGKHIPEVVGKDAIDASGKRHLGIITIPVPILKGNKHTIRNLREDLYTDDFNDVIAVDFSDIAQSCNVYSEYLQKVSAVLEKQHTYFGIAIFGKKKKVNKLTGSMPLLR